MNVRLLSWCQAVFIYCNACMHTHTYTCTHSHAHTHTCTQHTHTRTHTHTHTHTHTTHAHTHTHTHTGTHTHTCAHSTLTHTRAHTHTHTHTHTHSHTHTHTHMHAHTHCVLIRCLLYFFSCFFFMNVTNTDWAFFSSVYSLHVSWLSCCVCSAGWVRVWRWRHSGDLQPCAQDRQHHTGRHHVQPVQHQQVLRHPHRHVPQCQNHRSLRPGRCVVVISDVSGLSLKTMVKVFGFNNNNKSVY